jgi:stage V sporulation protein AD
MQLLALDKALKKGGRKPESLDLIFAGDLLNQCIGSGFSLRSSGIPFCGLYGACSTMAESLALAAMAIDGGHARCAAALTSSHFASAERQYRLPLVYGGQRTPTAQWTVTGAGCVLLEPEGNGPVLTGATIGQIVDKGICDANNMGAAMAPAAFSTIRAHFDDLNCAPEDFDLIVTGDLGTLGKEILIDLFRKDGVPIQNQYDDCGTMIYDIKRQDVHAGGSGCGCSASVLCGTLLPKMLDGTYRRILFCGTGALLSPTSTQQGESIPAVCHAVELRADRG